MEIALADNVVSDAVLKFGLALQSILLIPLAHAIILIPAEFIILLDIPGKKLFDTPNVLPKFEEMYIYPPVELINMYLPVEDMLHTLKDTIELMVIAVNVHEEPKSFDT